LTEHIRSAAVMMRSRRARCGKWRRVVQPRGSPPHCRS